MATARETFEELLASIAPGKTQQQVAEATGVCVRTLWRLKSGIGPRGASPQTIEALTAKYCKAKSEAGLTEFRRRVKAAVQTSRKLAAAQPA